jgi:uncharacterized protein DUF4396
VGLGQCGVDRPRDRARVPLRLLADAHPAPQAGTALGAAIGIALVADTFSIATMELVDNTVLLVWPGALDAGLGDLLFWGSLAISFAVAWGPTFFVNRALIRRGKGHARAHAAHSH